MKGKVCRTRQLTVACTLGSHLVSYMCLNSFGSNGTTTRMSGTEPIDAATYLQDQKR